MRYFYEKKGGCVWRLSPDGSLHFRWSEDRHGWLRSCCKIGEFLTPDGYLRSDTNEYKENPFDDEQTA